MLKKTSNRNNNNNNNNQYIKIIKEKNIIKYMYESYFK